MSSIIRLFNDGALLADVDTIEELTNILLLHTCWLLDQCRCNSHAHTLPTYRCMSRDRRM